MTDYRYAQHGIAKEVPFRARGAIARLFAEAPHHEEILVEGPAGTGKSRGVLEWVLWLCENHPGIRVLLVRQTRASLTDSTLVTFEEEVLAPIGHYLVRGGPLAESRSRYRFRNGSVIVLAGLDRPEKTFSTQYDVIVVEEAIEVSLDAWEKLIRANRNARLGYNVMVAVTNPGRKRHWLNIRPEQWTAPGFECTACREFEWSLVTEYDGRPVYECDKCGALEFAVKRMLRLVSRHKENPAYFDKGRWTEIGRRYMRRLQNMSGARRDRLYRGLWVTESGLVFPMWEPSVHQIDGHLAADEYGRRLLTNRGNPVLVVESWGQQELELLWRFASYDWGFRAPGSLSLWGVDDQKRLFRLRQIYQTQRQLDWWADRVEAWDKSFNLEAVVVDPSKIDAIELFNDRLGTPGGRKRIHARARKAKKRSKGQRSVGADNRRDVGFDMVRYALTGHHPDKSRPLREVKREEMDPRMFFLRNGLEFGPDPDLLEAGEPVCTEDELDGLVWKEVKEGQAEKEEHDPACADHGIDDTRYACMWHWKRDQRRDDGPPRFPKGTKGSLLGHDDVLRRTPRKRGKAPETRKGFWTS